MAGRLRKAPLAMANTCPDAQFFRVEATKDEMV
jgi:hypothetical protein